MIGRRIAVLVALASVACSASAHRLSPAFFGLTEIEPSVFHAQWKVSISGGLADALQPQVPAGCAVEDLLNTRRIAPSTRPEELTPDAWCDLSNALAESDA